MGLRRGFKSEANWYARSLREELRLTPQCPLCPWRLAGHLEFPVVPLSKYREAQPEAVAYLLSACGQQEFSAITIFDGNFRLIIHNDGHDRPRQAADIAHELAHGLLLHPPKPPLDANGSRHYNAEFEEEANWLGPALLVSDEAAMRIAERGWSAPEASKIYGVSLELLRMRLNVSGVAMRLARRRSRQSIDIIRV